jgi:hypothetical protein
VGHDRWVLSQVLLPGTNFYLGVAERVFGAVPAAEQIDGLTLSIFSWTNDAEIYRGNWRLLGERPMQEALNPDQAYRVAISGEMMVENLRGEVVRKFNAETDQHLSYRKVRSPLLFQDIVHSAVCGS